MKNQTTNNATTLQAKIVTLNTMHEHAALIFKHEREQLLPLIGKNPLKKDGSFKATVKHSKIDIPNKKIYYEGFDFWAGTTYYFNASDRCFWAVLRTCVNGGGSDSNGVSKHCIYESLNLILFNIDKDGFFEDLQNKEYTKPAPIIEKDVLKQVEKLNKIGEDYKTVFNSINQNLVDTLYLPRLKR